MLDNPFAFMLLTTIGVMSASAISLAFVPEQYLFVVERAFFTALVLFLGWMALVLLILILSS